MLELADMLAETPALPTRSACAVCVAERSGLLSSGANHRLGYKGSHKGAVASALKMVATLTMRSFFVTEAAPFAKRLAPEGKHQQQG